MTEKNPLDMKPLKITMLPIALYRYKRTEKMFVAVAEYVYKNGKHRFDIISETHKVFLSRRVGINHIIKMEKVGWQKVHSIMIRNDIK